MSIAYEPSSAGMKITLEPAAVEELERLGSLVGMPHIEDIVPAAMELQRRAVHALAAGECLALADAATGEITDDIRLQ